MKLIGFWGFNYRMWYSKLGCSWLEEIGLAIWIWLGFNHPYWCFSFQINLRSLVFFRVVGLIMNVNVWICFYFSMWRFYLHQLKKGLIFVGFDFGVCLDANKYWKEKKCRLRIFLVLFFSFFFKNWGRKINILFNYDADVVI